MVEAIELTPAMTKGRSLAAAESSPHAETKAKASHLDRSPVGVQQRQSC